jgi:hypothetical protein
MAPEGDSFGAAEDARATIRTRDTAARALAAAVRVLVDAGALTMPPDVTPESIGATAAGDQVTLAVGDKTRIYHVVDRSGPRVPEFLESELTNVASYLTATYREPRPPSHPQW